MLQNAFSRTSPSLLLRLSHQVQVVALYSVQIVVPALGDSISDGEQLLCILWAVSLLSSVCSIHRRSSGSVHTVSATTHKSSESHAGLPCV